MNIFDLEYDFRIITFDQVEDTVIQRRIEINRFVLNNSTDAVVQCYVQDEEEKMRPILLTEMQAGFGYTNTGDALRYTIPAMARIYFVVVGDAPTEGKIYVTMTQ